LNKRIDPATPLNNAYHGGVALYRAARLFLFGVMRLIEIYHNGIRKAILTADADGVEEPWVDIRLNGESTFEFLLPLTSRKWPKIIPECRIIADGREYVILRPDAVDIECTQDGEKWGKVTAAESWILLDKDFVSVSNDPDKPTPADMEVRIISGGAAAGGYPQGSAGSALTYILQGSGWALGMCDVEGVHDIETEKLSRLENIKKVQEIWGGYLVWDSINKTVSLRAEAWQNYDGFQIRYAKNLKHITRTGNYDIVTRLYPFGKDDLDISSVNDGKKCIENFSYTENVYIGKYVNQEITTAQELKDKAIEELAKICRPRYTYRVGLVDLRELPEYSHETFAVGDMADVIDPDVGTGRVRILRHKYNLFQRYLCELEIGDPEERLEIQLQTSFQAADYVNSNLKPNATATNILKGLLAQTWQECKTENVDPDHEMELNVYLPSDIQELRKCLLRFTLEPFRTDETGMSEAGGETVISTGPTGDPHTHDITTSDHDHSLERGICEGTVASNVTVKINSIDRTSALGGPFNADNAGLNIAPYMNIGQWNKIVLGSSQLGRIDAKVFIQALMSV
jgi:hypothetical protein